MINFIFFKGDIDMNIKKALPLFCRLLLGSIFVLYGLNNQFELLTLPTLNVSETDALHTISLMLEGRYLAPLVKWLPLIGGVLLLSNKAPHIGLFILAPFAINMFSLYVFQAHAFEWLGILVFGLEGLCLYFHKDQILDLINS